MNKEKILEQISEDLLEEMHEKSWITEYYKDNTFLVEKFYEKRILDPGYNKAMKKLDEEAVYILKKFNEYGL